VNLTRLIIHDLEATLEARRVADELDRVRKRVKAAVSNEDARPRPVLPLGGPAIPKTRKQPTCGNHPRQIVQRMLDYIHQHYCRPMQLGDLAEAMNMNAAYLSDLFHTALGVTFHHYLEQLRLAKARELLRNPVNRVCEVACAVGYVNPNHFREVFKAHVGVSPSAWRETVGM
jgi:transcriptional regulator GlxA family with amidase domain